MDCSLPGSPVHGISQARLLERVSISFSRGSSWLRDQTCMSCAGRQILYHWDTREAQVLETCLGKSLAYRSVVLNFLEINSYELYYICTHICKGVFLTFYSSFRDTSSPRKHRAHWSHRNDNIQGEYVEGDERRTQAGELSDISLGFPGGAEVKASACSVGDLGSIPGLGRSPGEGNGIPLQYSCLENPMDRGAWWLQSTGRKESDTTERLHFHFHFRKFNSGQFSCSVMVRKEPVQRNQRRNSQRWKRRVWSHGSQEIVLRH